MVPPVGKVFTGGAAASAGTFHAAQIAAAVIEMRKDLPNIARHERRSRPVSSVGTGLRGRQLMVRRRLPTRRVKDGGSNSTRAASLPAIVFWSGLFMSEPQCRAYMRIQIATFFGQRRTRVGDPRDVQFHVEIAAQNIARAEADARHRQVVGKAAVADVVVVAAADVVESQQA